MSTKERLLKVLKDNLGSWVSGEGLGADLNISRAAISKHIRHLREMGYNIESATKKGYRMMEMTGLLLPNEIMAELDSDFIKKIVHLEETVSTNEDAKKLAAEGAAPGTLVIAEKQLGGRGRKGRSWFSPASGGIYTSLVIRPNISLRYAPRITIMTAVAAAEAVLECTDLEVKIKWPNDLLIGGKKLAGILTEMSSDMESVDYIVVGLGLNVNTPATAFRGELGDIATSIYMETGKKYSRLKLLCAFLRNFEKYYQLLLADRFELIIQRWKKLSDIVGKQVQVNLISRKLRGEVVDIDNEGVLIIRDEDNKLQRIISGDVTIL